MYQYQIDCESAMNNIFSHLAEQNPVFDRSDIFNAFEEAGSDYEPHLRSALKYNACATIEELLDKACACDMLIEFNGEYIAIDWTDSEEHILSKVEKHKWLKPIYAYLGIDYTLVVQASGYHLVRTKSHEMIARIKASGVLLKHITKMIEKGKTNSILEFRIETKL